MVDSSLDAWSNVKETIANRHLLVYNSIVKYPDHTAAEHAKILHKPLNTISGRFTELRDLGRIARMDRRVCAATGGSAYTWKAI